MQEVQRGKEGSGCSSKVGLGNQRLLPPPRRLADETAAIVEPVRGASPGLDPLGDEVHASQQLGPRHRLGRGVLLAKGVVPPENASRDGTAVDWAPYLA